MTKKSSNTYWAYLDLEQGLGNITARSFKCCPITVTIQLQFKRKSNIENVELHLEDPYGTFFSGEPEFVKLIGMVRAVRKWAILTSDRI